MTRGLHDLDKSENPKICYCCQRKIRNHFWNFIFFPKMFIRPLRRGRFNFYQKSIGGGSYRKLFKIMTFYKQKMRFFEKKSIFDEIKFFIYFGLGGVRLNKINYINRFTHYISFTKINRQRFILDI